MSSYDITSDNESLLPYPPLSGYASRTPQLVGYADDSTLMLVVPSPHVRVVVAESLICDLGRVSEWCDLRGMKLNGSKTKTMIV